jgi:protein-tyrosine phosphatase
MFSVSVGAFRRASRGEGYSMSRQFIVLALGLLISAPLSPAIGADESTGIPGSPESATTTIGDLQLPVPQPPLADYADLPPGTSLGIASVPNLRDAGGYPTSDGRTVRRGLVYRSNQLNPIDPTDLAKIADLGLKNGFDLRTADEREARPDQLPGGVRNVWLNVLADSSNLAPAQLDALFEDPKKANDELGGGRIEAILEEAYREFITLPSARASFRELFVVLSDPFQLPALYHCTTGKDRTGWASAALLTLLGVPMAEVMADFLRSNDYILPLYAKEIDAFVAAGGVREIVEAAFGVKAEYLKASFDEMEKQYGTIENYFATALGIDGAAQKALRNMYLETN